MFLNRNIVVLETSKQTLIRDRASRDVSMQIG